MSRVIVVVAAAVCGLCASPAFAVDQTYTFDDIAAGTTVTSQYAGRGLTFGPSVAGQRQATATNPVVATVGTTAAASGDRVGRVQRFCIAAECAGTAEVWGSFGSGQARVDVSAGAFGTASNTLTITGFNSGGAQVSQAQASVPAGSFKTKLSLSTPTAVIRFFRIRGSTLGTFGIDSVFSSTTPATGPEFSISVPFGTHVVPQGGSVNVPVTLTRRNSSGTITISATNLRTGMTATPVSSTLSTASSTASSTTVSLKLNGAANAAPLTDHDITVTATPGSSAAGTGTRSQIIRVRLLVLFDVRITGVEPTQGIQRSAFASVLSTTTRSYAGVPLQYNGRTIVRVYGNTARGGQPVGGTVARLFGFNSSGQALPGSPLFPDGGSRTVQPGSSATETLAERITPTGAWTFTLPLSWTGFGRPSAGNLFTQAFFATTLRAVVEPPLGSVAFRECDGCSANDSLTLTGVGYSPTCCVTIASAVITASGGSTPRPIDEILATGLRVTPLEVDLKPYGTTLDLTDKLERNSDGNLVINRDAAYDALNRFNQSQGGGEVAIGILSPEFSDGSGQTGLAVFDDLQNRPFTSSAHELGHALSRPHASAACNGGGEAWPPDETGLIRGIALDRGAASPYALFATPASLDGGPATLPTAEGGGDASAFYDFMSYCATDANAWISTKGWSDTLNAWPSGNLRTPRASSPGALQFQGGIEASGAVTIQSLRPAPTRQEGGFGPTDLRLIVKDRQGAVLADVPVLGRPIHAHRRFGATTGATTFLKASADVDYASAGSVEIARDGVIVAGRVRSVDAPTGAFLSPKRATLVGRGDKLTIRWRAADRDGDRVEATIEWSAQGGRPGTWRTVYLGRNGASVALPSEYFGGSSRAFLRLRLSDGFNETVVLSPPFRTIHRNPRIRITAPRSVRRDATLVLSARARDETGAPLTRRRLQWFEGRRPLGRGDAIRVTGARPGTHRYRVVATDPRGRRSGATVRVQVVAVAPAFTRLVAPRHATPRARSVRLSMAASLRSKLVIRGGRRRVTVSVGTRPRSVRVPIVAQGGLLRLRLALTADRRTTVRSVEVDRS